MSDDPFAPPGPPGAPPPSPWTRAPWGPPGSGTWGGPDWNVVQPLDPFQTLMHRRRRGLWYGLAALGLAVLTPPAAFAGVVLLIVGVGFLMLLGVVVAVVTSAVWALISLVMISRNRVEPASDVLWMLPALATLALLAYHVMWFLIRA